MYTVCHSVCFKLSLPCLPPESDVDTAPRYRSSLLVLYYMVSVYVDENLSFVHFPTMNMIKFYKGTRRLRRNNSSKTQQKGRKAYRHKNEDVLEENDSARKVKSEARENRGLAFRRYRLFSCFLSVGLPIIVNHHWHRIRNHSNPQGLFNVLPA